MEFLGNIALAVGSIAFIISSLNRTRRSVTKMRFISSALFALGYFLVLMPGNAVISATNAIRSFLIGDPRINRNQWANWGMVAFFVVVSTFGYIALTVKLSPDNFLYWLPLVATLSSTVGMGFAKIEVLKVLLLGSHIAYIAFFIGTSLWFPLVAEVFAAALWFVWLAKHRKSEKLNESSSL